MTSTPFVFSTRTSAMFCSGPQPASSSIDKRMNSGLCAGQCSRTHSTISIARRMRFAGDPP